MADPVPQQQTDDNAFLVGLVSDDQIAQIAKATGVPAEVVADAMAFEKKWTDAGLPATEQGMGARTMAAQAVMALVLGMNVELKLVLDYLVDALAATKAIDAKYAQQQPAAPAQAAPGQPQEPVEGEDDDEGGDEDEDDEGGDDVEIEEDGPQEA